MSRAVGKVLSDPAMKVRFTQLGISPTLLLPTQFDAVLKADWLHLTALIADFKILPD